MDKAFAQTKPTPPSSVSIIDSALYESLIITGGGNTVFIGITLEEHEKSLKKQIKETRNELEKANANERATLEKKLADVTSKLQNITTSYEKLKAQYAKMYNQLPSLKNTTNEVSIEKAQKALKRGDTAEAEKLFTETLNRGIKQATLAAMAAFQLAVIAEQKVDYEKAYSYYKKAVELESGNPGYLNEAGIMATTLGRYAEGEPLFRRALEILEKSLGPDDPAVASILYNLATLYFRQGLFSEAEPLHKRSLEMREKSLGPNDPAVAGSLYNLALLYFGQGRYAEAEPLYKRSIAIMEKEFGIIHPTLVRMYDSYSMLLRMMGGRRVEAEEYDRKAERVKKNNEKLNNGLKRER